MGGDLSYVAQYLKTRVLKQLETRLLFGVIKIPYINSAQICSVTEMNLIHVDKRHGHHENISLINEDCLYVYEWIPSSQLF